MIVKQKNKVIQAQKKLNRFGDVIVEIHQLL